MSYRTRFGTIEQALIWLLESKPGCRYDYNRLVMGYWIHVDGFGTQEKNFDATTPLETIVREARNLWRKRPDLSPDVARGTLTATQIDFFTTVTTVFPGSELAQVASTPMWAHDAPEPADSRSRVARCESPPTH